MNIGTAIAGTIFGELAKKSQDRYNRKSMEIQNQYLTQQNRQNQAIQLENWEKTNAPAQVEQYKKAGLNVGLMYGSSGTGGATMGTQGAGMPTGGGNFTDSGISATMLDIASNEEKKRAEIDLIKANEENIKADTSLKLGPQKEQAEWQIKNLAQDLKNKEAIETAQHIDNGIKRLELRIKDTTEEDTIRLIKNEADKSFYELQNLAIEEKFNKETYETRVKTLTENYALIVANKLNIKQNTALTEKIVKYYDTYVNIAQQQVNIAQQNANTSERAQKTNEKNEVNNRYSIMNNYELQNQKIQIEEELKNNKIFNDNVGLIFETIETIGGLIKPFGGGKRQATTYSSGDYGDGKYNGGGYYKK